MVRSVDIFKLRSLLTDEKYNPKVDMANKGAERTRLVVTNVSMAAVKAIIEKCSSSTKPTLIVLPFSSSNAIHYLHHA